MVTSRWRHLDGSKKEQVSLIMRQKIETYREREGERETSE